MMGNTIRTCIFLSVLALLLAWLGHAVAGPSGLTAGLFFGVIISFMAYQHGDQRILHMYKAQEVDASSSPALYQIVTELVQRKNMPMPRVYLMHEAQPNIFSTGRSAPKASLVVSEGLLNLLDGRELKAIVGHELEHIQRGDGLISMAVVLVAGAFTGLALQLQQSDRYVNMVKTPATASQKLEVPRKRLSGLFSVLVIFLLPVAATITQIAITRARYFEADQRSVEFCQDPQALANALHKIQHGVHHIRMTPADEHPETAHMMIIHPLANEAMDRLFMVHPRTEERIQRLLTPAHSS